MWKQVEKPRTVLASRNLVNEFVNMDPAPYDRPLSEKRMQVYERILQNGEFRTVTWASCVCLETNNTYRVNGKHTATLLAKIDPLPEFHITVERYQADTLKDVANLYNTFDSGLASRTVSDINAAFAATVPELREVSHRLINLIVSAAAFLKWSDSELKKVPPAERAEELLENVDFCIWLPRIVAPGGGGASGISRQLYRSTVIAAMMATFRKTPRLAEQFWLEVRDETNANRDNATRTLARFLINSAMASARGGPKEKKIVSPREMYAKSIHAWNAWRRGETTRLNYYAEAELPVPTR